MLARNRIRKTQGRTFYLRVYPQGGLAAHVVGYSTVVRARAGLEESMNDFLTGSNSNLSTVVDRTLDRFRGLTREGNDLVLTLQPEAQRVATEQLRGACGAAVALDPRTGAVLAMASSPTYDPNLVEDDFRAVLQTPGACPRPAALLNRATQGLFIPGSTFKVVTAAAALESGRYTPETQFDDPGYCVVYGKRVFNYADQGVPSGFGNVSLAEALAELHQLGLLRYRQGRWGRRPSSSRRGVSASTRFRPSRRRRTSESRAACTDAASSTSRPTRTPSIRDGSVSARSGCSRRRCRWPWSPPVSPTAVSSMEPFVVDRILKPDGEILTKTQPDELSQATSRQTAAELAAMMELVVESGTGTAAQIPGVRVAGKTGTAETGRPGANDTWFIAFAPVDNPRVAVAVALSDQAGTGGATAAPVARAIMEAVLG